ncbi:hypothetical protein Fmac_022871 [Flemingia macrophylla]|uniref:BHLH domain-containing protein n=1 Tax=Flemingia macrophylla TaxID=520843 RepID=A0ABD1LK41_9FABA
MSMYPSSSSSSSSQSMGQGLTRYGSAPGSLLATTVDAVIGRESRPYYSADTACKDQRYEYGSALLRQKSSPPGFLSTTHNVNTFTITRPSTSTSTSTSMLNSQLSFTTPTPEDPWDNSTSNSTSIAFSTKCPKTTNDPDNILHCLNAFDSQFTLPQTSLEMATVENMLRIPQDSVPCKIRAKRGCATHPRSIAERERRTRISGKLKKLQDLVPNMDKQTSYADMLDLAVQHIKGLQSQVQKLHKELENCTCGCTQNK